MMKLKLPRIAHEFGFWAMAATVAPVVWYSATGGSFVWLPAITGFWLILLIVVGCLWLVFSRPSWYLSATARWKFWLRRVGIVALLAGILVSVPLTRWPLRLTFAVSQPALDDLANRVERGETFRSPVRCGLLLVQQAGMCEFYGAGRVPCLWIEYHGAGGAGLARGLPNHQKWEYNGRVSFPINVSHLTGEWVQTDED